MKRSQATGLLAVLLIGLVVGFLVEIAFAASGAPIVVPPVTLPVTLILLGTVIVSLAWQVRQGSHRKALRRIDPFWAMRVAVLSKATSLSASLLFGAALGIVLYILTRSVVPAVTSLWLAIGTAIGAALMLTAGLVAEHFCTLPPDDEIDDSGGTRA
ncbi:DUF3180 domain-containing protein [Cryobacterium serini]|uniref:DUF3180 domain-containing protein n=1 Tax=Cryobacterium serini TaxID=1259201 RepID=A0A4R9BP73_9MICO|nr:DUF3180 domain-containing protein [Cryobacterium serini]TFD87868.1 DUF3180 domain-containing protein [Cryobacterium serini]